ncbi:MAG TPA: hypothetical protein VJ914_36775 [Pseudonocardiaceae bacterium]|nr:hypothetical protein [Pseudonocardiaceae bacterium]
MTKMTTTRPFSIDLPEGMTALPTAAEPGAAQALAASLADGMGLPADDVSAGVVGDALTVFGALLGDAGIDFAAMGLFRSPDDPKRPVSVVVTGARIPSNHASPEVAIAGLRQLSIKNGADTVEVVHLSGGEAVIAVDESMQQLVADDATPPAAVLTRKATAWIPDTTGSTIAVVSVISPSWQDWQHTCELAVDLFETFRWET